MTVNTLQVLKSFGATEDEVVLFNSSGGYKSFNYLSLINSKRNNICIPDGVIESNGRPILYFVDETNLANYAYEKQQQINKTLDVLACRGENTFLAIVNVGILTVYPVDTNNNSVEGIYTTSLKKQEPHLFIRDLIEGNLPENINALLYSRKKKSAVEELLFNLLKTVGRDLNSTKSLSGKHETILSLLGRALLTRFLLDREIITSVTFPELFSLCNPQECFSNPENITLINNWLDVTFNGDLLQLPIEQSNYLSWFSQLDTEVFEKLSYVLSHTNEHGQYSLPGFINFAHVPVGLLSEVYERYAHENLNLEIRKKAKIDSIHYTPRHIAEYMLNQAFEAVSTCEPHNSVVLDPSCGAGVFVVLAFKRLIFEHWKKYDKPPDTFEIRGILYSQISGFDINKPALTLAALGLYLSAIELDPEPLPTSKLKFEKNLIGSVLHCVNNEYCLNYEKKDLGSLGCNVNASHNHKYDIVIGNPPWSSLVKGIKEDLITCIKGVAQRRDAKHLSNIVSSHQNPDQVPDLPFVWKSMEWGKHGGTIALALHARFLFKNSKIGFQSRADLFKALNITGILNCSALRQSNVWPLISTEFCLLFAKNDIPNPSDFFYFVSPQYEQTLNEKQGRIRVDDSNANPVQSSALLEKPYLLKTLFRGTILDANIVQYLNKLVSDEKLIPIDKYWNNYVGKKQFGVGLQTSSTKQDATFLIEMKAAYLTTKDMTGYSINSENLPFFNIPRLHRTRNKELYRSPLIIMKKAIGAKKGTKTARISLDNKPVAYTESFYGFSTYGHSTPELLAKYTFIILNSDLLLYYILMTSSQYGVEREVIHKSDIERFPIIPVENLSSCESEKCQNIFDQFIKSEDFELINDYVYSLYNLNHYDKQVIKDSLAVALPISNSKKIAQKNISSEDEKYFFESLITTLKPFDVNVELKNYSFNSWKFITLYKKNTSASPDISNLLTTIANSVGSSKIIIPADGVIHVGLLNQYRYWTPSRARLLALLLIKDYSKYLKGLK
jgi:hypothetical protein